MNTEDVNDPEVKDVQDDTQAPEANAELKYKQALVRTATVCLHAVSTLT